MSQCHNVIMSQCHNVTYRFRWVPGWSEPDNPWVRPCPYLCPAKPPTPPQWKALVWPLQTDTWLGLAAAFVSATLVLSALSRPRWNGNPHFEWADCKSALSRYLILALFPPSLQIKIHFEIFFSHKFFIYLLKFTVYCWADNYDLRNCIFTV